MTSFSEVDHARDADGKFASMTTAETDAGVLDEPGVTMTRPGHYRQALADGNYRTFSVDEVDPQVHYSTYYDQHGNWHRDDGPACVDPGGLEWTRHGRTHRDPDEGPAWMHQDGQCGYMADGKVVTPTAEQLRRHGIESAVVFGKPHLYYPDTPFADFAGSDARWPDEEAQHDYSTDERFDHYFREH